MKRTFIALLSAYALTQWSFADAGVIHQAVSFANLNAIAMCNSPGSCVNSISGQPFSGPPVVHLFQNFANTNAGLAGATLTDVTWRLQGVLHVSIDFSIPAGYSAVVSGEGSFPFPNYLFIPGGPDVIPLSSTGAVTNCVGGTVCQAAADRAFDVVIHVTDLSAYLDPDTFLTEELVAETNPSFLNPGLIPTYTGTVRTTFTGGVNELSLDYTFVPEPPTLALLAVAILGLGMFRRRRRLANPSE